MRPRTLATAAAIFLSLVMPAVAQRSDTMPAMDMPPKPASQQSKPDQNKQPMDHMPMDDQHPDRHQDQDHGMPADMPGMNMDDDDSMMMPPRDLIGSILNHMSSGTSAEPPSTPQFRWMDYRSGWMLMLHGNAFLADIQQHAEPNPAGLAAGQGTSLGLAFPDTRHRGSDKLFSTNWIMPMAMRKLGPGQLTVRTMLSFEPATVTGRNYPELFQQGETAYGKPIVDGQHPHDFFMELAALYDIRLGEHALLSFYGAPIGDPAIGPTAYPHRWSASEDPIAALGHHQQDSTHIAFNVLTVGFTYRGLRFEQSGFHGAEPDERHWRFQPSPNGLALDSYASRVTFTPAPNWTAQYSWAHIASPEALYPGEDQARQTASVMYNRPLGAKSSPDNMSNLHSGNLAATLIWGRTRSLDPAHASSPQNSYLAEASLQFATRNYAWFRAENAGRSNELLLTPGTPLPSGFEEAPIGHVAAYTVGYDREFHIAPHLRTPPGAQVTGYSTPRALTPIYGDHPFGSVAHIRFRIAAN